MRIKITCALAIMLALCLQFPVLAYDFREDTMNESDRSAYSLLDKAIFSDLYNPSITDRACPYDQRVDWSLARKVFVFEPRQFIRALKAGTLEEDILKNATAVWKVPVYEDEDGYGYVIVGTNDENPGYVTVSADANALNQAAYLFMDTQVPVGVDTGNASVYIVSVPECDVDFITIISSETELFIPYSTCPEWIRLNNGEEYSAEDVLAALSGYDVSLSWSASGGGNANNTLAIASGVFLLILGGCICSFFAIRKIQSRTKQ